MGKTDNRDSGLLPLEQALERVLLDLRPLDVEIVDLLSSSGRFLAVPQVAGRELPPFTNSAMDGYAVFSADVQGAKPETPVELPVVAKIAAGDTPKEPLRAGQAIRIFTGAPLPENADAVVIQENTTASGNSVGIMSPAVVGENVRLAGEDVRVGDEVLGVGSRISPGEIALLAALGRSQVRVFRQPVVAIVPTGDEVLEIDEPPRPGCIANSNSYMLGAQAVRCGARVNLCPPAPDEIDGLAAALSRAAASADLVITTGGVSVGDYDCVKQVLSDAGSVDFWKVAIKPGKPLAYGRLGGVPLIGLPGNPVSSFVTFELFARAAIMRLAGLGGGDRPDTWFRDNQGGVCWFHRRFRARLDGSIRRDRQRRLFARAALAFRDGEWWVMPAAKQGSGQLTSMVGQDSLIDIRAGDGTLGLGDEVSVLGLD